MYEQSHEYTGEEACYISFLERRKGFHLSRKGFLLSSQKKKKHVSSLEKEGIKN